MLRGLDEEWDEKKFGDRLWKILYTFLFVLWNRGDSEILELEESMIPF